jgi:homocysteine S-methyltransferase
MLGMISDLLGAAAAGLRNLLLVTGDPPRLGPYADTTAVFDIDAIGLTNLVSRLNYGLDPGSNPIGDPTSFVIGVALNHTAVDEDRELRRMYWKADAGAEFAVTQPVFDVAEFERFLRRVEEFGIPVIGGVWPFASLENVEFLANEVPGQRVPRSVVDRMRAAQDRGPESAAAEGVAIAREILGEMRPMVQGVHLSLPFGRVDRARAVLED